NAVRQTAVQATGSDRGKIRIARVMNYGPAFISILLPYSSKMETFNLNIEQARERTPASVELDGDSNNLLFPGTEHQIKFKILDQYGDQLNTTLPDYKVDYKLERVSGESGAITTKGAAVLTDAAPEIRREINDSSGKGVTFVADTLKMGTYRLKASLVRVDAGGAVIGTLAAASSVAEVFGGSQALTYEMDLDDALFAAGRYYYEHGVIRSVTDATYLLENKDVFAREIEISAKDELGREVTLPSNIVRSIGSANPDMIGDDDVNRIIGLNAGKSTVTVIFDSPTGARTLSKEVEVKYERPAIQEVKVDKSANVVDSAQLNGLLPWDANLMKKITVKDQFGDSFDNDKLARYNDIFGIVYLIGDIHFRPNTAPAMKDVLYIDGGGRIVYQPGSGNPIDNNVEDFTLTAITPDGKTYSTFISVQ
ncbi:hypothetical protein K0U00_29790, partial [Paenibacillus sepulcri]|nr:hypothetical protein [Paenibacillus sepulcri]